MNLYLKPCGFFFFLNLVKIFNSNTHLHSFYFSKKQYEDAFPKKKKQFSDVENTANQTAIGRVDTYRTKCLGQIS